MLVKKFVLRSCHSIHKTCHEEGRDGFTPVSRPHCHYDTLFGKPSHVCGNYCCCASGQPNFSHAGQYTSFPVGTAQREKTHAHCYLLALRVDLLQETCPFLGEALNNSYGVGDLIGFLAKGILHSLANFCIINFWCTVILPSRAAKAKTVAGKLHTHFCAPELATCSWLSRQGHPGLRIGASRIWNLHIAPLPTRDPFRIACFCAVLAAQNAAPGTRSVRGSC